jgi:peptidoglycan/LPS O-acetylase OafA/YrhL
MLMVLLSHASFATGNTSSLLGPYLTRFELAVPMFFVLSGFLLWRPYALAALQGTHPLAAPRFLRRRALRIFPGYWAALLGIVVLFGAGVLTDAWDWICNLLLLQQFGVEEPFRITQAWSIGVELSFYLLVPIFARVVLDRAGGRIGGLLVACGLLFAAGWAFRLAVVLIEPSWQAQSLNWLPMYLDFFAVGMVLGTVSASVQAGGEIPAPLAALGAHPAACWTAAFVIFLLVAQMDPPATPFGLNGLEYLPRQAAYSVASVIWLAPAMFGDQSRGRLRQVLSSRPFTWLGAVSLSFYLWHLELIHQAQKWTVPDYDQLTGLAVFSGNFWEVSAIAITATLVVAGLVHRLVEVPFLRLKDRPLRDLPLVYRDTVMPAGRD